MTILSSAADKPVVSTHIDIDAIVKTNLSPLPGSSLRVSALLRDVNVSTRKLAEAVGYDPSLTARVLRLANSPIYASQKDVNSLHQAIELVGTKSLYDILMVGMTVDAFAREIRGSVLGRTIWEHSLAVALLVKELSRTLGMRGTEEGFICGLLHDIGKIMLLRADAETYSQILDKKDEAEMLSWEMNVFGYTHAQVGALVVSRWQLPEVICHIILNHHNPLQSVQSVFISNLINVADTVANYNGYGLRFEIDSAALNSESAIMLRLTESDLHTAWENIQTDLDEVVGTFS